MNQDKLENQTPRYFYSIKFNMLWCPDLPQPFPDSFIQRKLKECQARVEKGLDLEVTEADLPYLQKPEGEWEFRRPHKGDTTMSLLDVGVEIYMFHEPVLKADAKLDGYRWCQIRSNKSEAQKTNDCLKKMLGEASDKYMEMNAYQMSQMDRQIRILEHTTALIMDHFQGTKGWGKIILTASQTMSDILAGEGSDNKAQSAEPSDQPDYQEGVKNFLEKTAPELFKDEFESQQKMPPAFFSGDEKEEKSLRYFFEIASGRDGRVVELSPDSGALSSWEQAIEGKGCFGQKGYIALEVQEADLHYLKKPEADADGDWEFRKPVEGDTITFRHGAVGVVHHVDMIDRRGIQGYRWCRTKDIESTGQGTIASCLLDKDGRIIQGSWTYPLESS